MIWLFVVFFLLLAISATPLLGSFNIRWSLEIMIGLFAAFFVASLIIFFCYPMFS